MGQIQEQVHAKFKVFVGEPGTDHSLGSLANQVAQFVVENKVAAKSIGIEYLESSKRLIISLGYRDDEPSYPVELSSVSLGKIDISGNDFSALEKAMSDASQQHSNIICHELYVTESNEMLVVFMSHKA
ncbi:MAG TPA: hypothetical protein VFC63_26620 [Blastocatellia bacterium]|nr:hypothetical protein [Blastocatellia bacterium]